MKKIKISQKAFNRLVIAYRICGFLLILGTLIVSAILMDKLVEFAILLICYFTTRRKYSEQFHTTSMLICLITSLCVFLILLRLIIVKEISIACSAIFGILLSYISYYTETIHNKVTIYNTEHPQLDAFDVNNCTQAQLEQRMELLKLSPYARNFAIDAFILKLSDEELSAKYTIAKSSASMQKSRLKKKINKLYN